MMVGTVPENRCPGLLLNQNLLPNLGDGPTEVSIRGPERLVSLGLDYFTGHD